MGPTNSRPGSPIMRPILISTLSSLSALVLLGACGGGGSSSTTSGGAVTGLSLPGSLSVVTATGSSGGGSTITPGAGTGSFPADAEYFTDEAFEHVWDRSTEPLELINEILSMTGQTAAEEMVNKGDYRALIDASMGEKGGESGGSSSGQSSGTAQDFEDWTVRSTREDNDSPMYVRMWIPNEEEFFSGLIYGHGRIVAEPTDADPFGKFVLNFAMKESLSGPAMFKGVLKTESATAGRIGFSFYEEGGKGLNLPHDPGEFSEEVQVRVDMSADQLTGVARVRNQHRENFGMGDSGVVTEEYRIAFDTTHFLRELVGGTPELFHRDQFVRNTWRYNLYDAEGENLGDNVERDSGFGFRTAGGDFGWIGYWGMWAPEGVTVANGDTIYKQQFGPGQSDPVPYTVVQAPGRLIKNSKNTIPLLQVDGDDFRYWEFDAQTSTHAEFKVVYGHAGGTFTKTAIWDRDSNQWIDLETPEVIVLQPGDWLHLWSDGLGGSVNYVYGDTTLTYWKEEFVNGDSSDLFPSGVTEATLYGMIECLRSELTAAEAETGDVFLSQGSVSTPHLFEFHQDDLSLYHDTTGNGSVLTQVGLAEGEEPATGPFTWGMRTGPLLPNPPNTYGALSNPWDAWNMDVFYIYETGHNAWNKTTSLTDALGAAVSFDPPLVFTYTHSTDNDANGDSAHDGRTIQLEYNGNGDLWGIPHDGVDLNGDGEPDYWQPRFSILDGVAMGPNGTEYVVKAIDTELHLAEDSGGSTSLTLDGASSLSLPDGSDFSNPATVQKPVVTDPPAVIAGVVQ